MLTGKGKIGYLLFTSGTVLLVMWILQIFSADLNGSFGILLMIGAVVLLAGILMLRQDPVIQRTGWKPIWGAPPLSGRWRVAYFIIIPASAVLSFAFGNVAEGDTIERQWPIVVLALLALAVGWFLALSEFWQSRSLQK